MSKRTDQEFRRLMGKTFPEGPPTYTSIRVWRYTKRLAWLLGAIVLVVLSLTGLITIMVDHF